MLWSPTIAWGLLYRPPHNSYSGLTFRSKSRYGDEHLLTCSEYVLKANLIWLVCYSMYIRILLFVCTRGFLPSPKFICPVLISICFLFFVMFPSQFVIYYKSSPKHLTVCVCGICMLLVVINKWIDYYIFIVYRFTIGIRQNLQITSSRHYFIITKFSIFLLYLLSNKYDPISCLDTPLNPIFSNLIVNGL